jgi:phosphatidylglycerophosphate synthase
VIKASFGDRLDAWIHRFFPFLFWRPLHPDALTVFGAVVSVVAAIALARGELLAGGLLILFGGFFDLVDGVVARHQGVSTSFGAFLDSTLDRLVDSVLMLGLVVLYARSGDLTTAAVASAALVATTLTSYAKARAETVIPKLEGGLLERGERIGLLAAGALFDVMIPILWILAAGTTLTVAQRFSVAYRELGRLDAERDPAAGAGGTV